MRRWAEALVAPAGMALAIVLYFTVDASIGLVVALVVVAYAFSGAPLGGRAGRAQGATRRGGRSDAGPQ